MSRILCFLIIFVSVFLCKAEASLAECTLDDEIYSDSFGIMQDGDLSKKEPLVLGIIVKGWYSITHKSGQGTSGRVELKNSQNDPIVVPFSLPGLTKDTFTQAQLERLQAMAVDRVKKELNKKFKEQCEKLKCNEN